MLIYCTTNKEKYEVPISRTSGTYAGICPVCNSTRKHKGSKSFSFDVSKEVGKCHNCNHAFVTYKDFQPREYIPKSYVRPPIFVNNTELSDKMLRYFKSRGISRDTINEMKVIERLDFFFR